MGRQSTTTTTEAATQTATPPTRSYAEAATSTDRPEVTTEVSTQTEAVTSTYNPPTRSYVEAATKVHSNFPQVHPDRVALITPPANGASPTRTSKGTPPPQGNNYPDRQTQIQEEPQQTPPPPESSKPHHQPPPPATTHTRAIVLHAAPTKYKPGQMRRWIEEDNQGSVQALGIRWLLQENRSRKASILTGYLPKGQGQHQQGSSHGEKSLPHHTVRLG